MNRPPDFGVTAAVGGLVVFRYPGLEPYQRLIDTIAAAQQEEMEKKIVGLQAEAERVAEEARELAGEVPF